MTEKKILSEYRSKLRTAEEAVLLVKSGDWIDYGSNNAMPFSLDAALAARRDELYNVKIRGNLTPGPIQVAECDPTMEHFVYNTWHCGGYERRLCDAGRAFFIPMLFRKLQWYYENFLTVNVAMISVSPMDDQGYFSLAGAVGAVLPALSVAERIILEVNEAQPNIGGGRETKLHISQVDAVVEAGSRPLMTMPTPTPTETDEQIARHILPYIPDGATLQLGIGGIPSVLGDLIARSDIKDLGMHTELCSDAYLNLWKAGKLTNRKKTLRPGVGIFGLAIGSEELYSWLNDNPDIQGAPLSWVNDPAVIASMDNMISINACLNIDLYGQVSSESAGTRQISGTGGQLDFVTGASDSRGGRSFLCMSSAYTDKNGVMHSRILPSFSAGDIITTPRTQTYTVVTEYGVAELCGRSTWERADALISVAHPDFREELIQAAERQRIWLPSNKR